MREAVELTRDFLATSHTRLKSATHLSKLLRNEDRLHAAEALLTPLLGAGFVSDDFALEAVRVALIRGDVEEAVARYRRAVSEHPKKKDLRARKQRLVDAGGFAE
jgi:hypothetical protein